MTKAMEEARDSLWAPSRPEHKKIGWTYDFEQTERISRAAYDGTGYDAPMEVIAFVMAESDRRHATALAARDAEIERLRDALTEIGEGRPPNPVGDPWSFYDDLVAFARRALTAGGQHD